MCVAALNASLLLRAISIAAQFRDKSSAVYQLAHVPTGYPAEHDGIIIDECNPSAWLPEEPFTVGTLQAATAAVPAGSTADLRLACHAGDADRCGTGEDAPHRARAHGRARPALQRTDGGRSVSIRR